MTAIDLPTAILRGEDELPFVELGDGSTLQLLQVDIDQGLWVIRTKFYPGHDGGHAQAHRRRVRLHARPGRGSTSSTRTT